MKRNFKYVADLTKPRPKDKPSKKGHKYYGKKVSANLTTWNPNK